MSKAAREAAAATGELPHELLLRVSRGEAIGDHKPDFAERITAAIAAAPYFAPKMAAVEHSGAIGDSYEEFLAEVERIRAGSQSSTA